MTTGLFVIPLVTALLGWLMNRVLIYFIFYPVSPKKIMGIHLQGLLPARQQQLALGIAQFAARLAPMSMLEQKMADPAAFRKLMPVIEEKIDHFLRVKLKESMPVVGMFVGDKTIQQLKTVFVTELEIIFPVIMKNYAANLQQEFNLEKFIGDKLSAIPSAAIVTDITSGMKKELRLFQWAGAVSGFVLGLVSLALFLLIKN